MYYVLIILFAVLVCCFCDASVPEVVPKHLEILNDSGANLQVFWINPSTGQQMPFSQMYNGAHLSVDSFVNHTFVIRQTKLETKESRIGYVKVSNTDNQVVYVKENMEVEYADASKKASSEAANLTTALTQSCLGTVSDFSASNVNSTIDSFLACYEKGLTEIFKENNEEISYQAKALTHVANLLENYTCADESLTTTHSNDIRNWEHNGTSHDAHILHERPDSQIRLVTNFITPEECKAFEAAAARLLHRGTVANGNDGSRLSENHKAWQAGIRVPWEKEADGNHIAQYTRRMYAYANHATGYNMDVAGQEDMMSIQYFGQNGKHPPGSTFSEKTPDRYTPHCDGNCEGLPHRNGARVATMVSYCTAPTRGGSTHFQHAGVHVKPKVGSAAFFSYMNPESRLMDTGWTTHSGCPVIEGTKRIVVHWMRVGVSAETPWDSLNTLNIPKHMVEEFA